MNDTLKIIQTISKVGKIISKIVYICCIIGFCGCAIGIIAFACGAQILKFGGASIEEWLEKSQTNSASVYNAMVVGLVMCSAETVLAKFGEHYFIRELADGTPFNLGGAKELMRLGILTIAIPLGAVILSAIIQGIFKACAPEVVKVELSNYVSVSMGLVLLLTSLICKYGAEITETNGKAEEK